MTSSRELGVSGPASESWHSQITITVNPHSSNRRATSASLRRLFSILVFQKSRFRLGTVAFTHPSCPCQKQPWTNIAHRRDRLAMSGEPGRSRFLTRNPMPFRRSHARSCSSGFVSRCRIRPSRTEVSGSVASLCFAMNQATRWRWLRSISASIRRRCRAMASLKPSFSRSLLLLMRA